MLKKKLIIIGADFQWEEAEILRTTQLQNIEAEFFLLKNIELTPKGIQAENKKVSPEHTVFILRRSRGYQDRLIKIAKYLSSQEVIFTDSIQSIHTNLDKTHSLLSAQSSIFPHPPKTQIIPPKEKIFRENFLEFPCIVKPSTGRHGEGIVFASDFDALEKIISTASENTIVQQVINIDYEYRIFIIGSKCLGAVKKIPAKGSPVANYSAGASFEPMDIPLSHSEEAVKICQHQEIDIGGMDIACDTKGRHYFLEVNRCPEFRAFSQATSINIAEKIIDFAQNKK